MRVSPSRSRPFSKATPPPSPYNAVWAEPSVPRLGGQNTGTDAQVLGGTCGVKVGLISKIHKHPDFYLKQKSLFLIEVLLILRISTSFPGASHPSSLSPL